MKQFFFCFLCMDDVSFLSKVLNYNLSGFDLNLMATLVDKFTKAVITAERACRQSCFYYSCIHTRLMGQHNRK